MRFALTVSLTFNIVLFAGLSIYHNEGLKDQELIKKYIELSQTWKTNAYTALDLAQRCSEKLLDEEKK